PLDSFAQMKPFFLYTLLYASMMNCPLASWETSLQKMAQEQKVEILGLETIQEQIAVIDKVPYKEQAAALVDFVKDDGKAKKELETGKKQYFEQDIVGLELLLQKTPEMGKYGETFLKNRNERWVPIIEKAAAAKPTFFAVGAGHLGGADGVIALLRKAGYTVAPVQQ
ncbi:MAG: TraB/GumN family protein, partial [Acidobacteria bacterium]|nr:TraB/GumN family protein [Acidobacteriota bacterium]